MCYRQKQQSYVKVNVLHFIATAAVSQLGLSVSYFSNKGIQPSCTFQGLVPVRKVSPIQTDKLQAELYNHPDPNRVAYVLRSLKEGFHPGFEPSTATLKSTSKNLQSSSLHPAVIDKYLQNEVEMG